MGTVSRKVKTYDRKQAKNMRTVGFDCACSRVRAPECGPVDVRQIRRFLGVEKPESEWDVHDGTVMDKSIAQKLRDVVLSNTKAQT